MNIDDLTIGQARTLAALFPPSAPAASAAHPAIGRYVVIRAARSGVHVGILHSKFAQEVELREARHIWSWQGALTCDGIAAAGITGGKVDVEIPVKFLDEVIETIPCSAEAERCLRKI